jgi:hypothetical protein
MNSRKIGALAGGCTLAAVLVQYVPSYVLGSWMESGVPDVLPTFGTHGTTASVYLVASNVVGPLVTLTLALAVGYRLGRRVDVRREYRRLGKAAVAGCIVAIVAGFLLTGLFTETTWTGQFGAVDAFLLAGSFLTMVVQVGFEVALGIVAGAALGHFESDESPPASPTAVDTDRDSSAPSEAPDSGSQRSWPTR